MPGRQLLDDVAPRIHDEGRAVEHELVLSSDTVGIDEGQAGLARPGADLRVPGIVLPRVIGRTVGDDDQRRARLLRLPRGAGVPDILADQEPDGRAVDIDDARGAARLEIALLVEHRVVRQLLLAVNGAHATVGKQRERVVAASALAFGKSDDDRRVLHAGGQRRELAGTGVEKRRAQQQIFGRIPAERQLGRHDEARARASGRARRSQYRRTVAAQIPQDLVQLRDRDLHGGSVCTTKILACTARAPPCRPRSGAGLRRTVLAAGLNARENRCLRMDADRSLRSGTTSTNPLTIRDDVAIASIAAADWDALAGGKPLAAHAFLRALHETGCATPASGWSPCYLTAWRAGALVGALPLYAKAHSYGEYVFDWAWADAYRRYGRRYYPKLVAAIPFTPAPGATAFRL